MRRPLFVVCLIFTLLLSVNSASAHANLLRSDPMASAVLDSAPKLITLWFSEPLEPQFSSIMLLDRQGSPISTPPSAVDGVEMTLAPGDLPNGVITVVWRSVSAADGHAQRGSFAFVIGSGADISALTAPISETIPPSSAAVRWFDLIGLSLAVGSIAFTLFVTRDLEDRLRRLMGVGWVLAGVSALAVLLDQAAQSADQPLPGALSVVGAILFSTHFGMLWIGRLIAWSIMGGALVRRRFKVALTAGIVMLLLHSLYSHASATHDLIPAVAGDFLHLAAAALWIGGLAQFINLLIALRCDPRTLGRIVTRFSDYARLCVAALIVTGLYALWLEVGSVPAMLATLYGRALIVKLILLVPLIGIAAINLLLTARGLRAGRDAWSRRLRVLVVVEFALALGVFAGAAVMASADPGRAALAKANGAPDNTIAQFQILSGIHVHFDVSPGWVGQNNFTVTLYDLDANTLDDATLIRVRFDNRTQPVGSSEIRPTHTSDGEYHATAANLSTPGEWRARVTVARPNQFDVVADFTLNMQPPPIPPGLDMSVPMDNRQIALLVTGLALIAVGSLAGAQGTFRPLRGVGLLSSITILIGVVFLIGVLL